MKMLTEAPSIHPTAVVVGCDLGRWTEIQAQVTMRDVAFGDYSYIVRGGSAVWSSSQRTSSQVGALLARPWHRPAPG